MLLDEIRKRERVCCADFRPPYRTDVPPAAICVNMGVLEIRLRYHICSLASLKPPYLDALMCSNNCAL